MAILRIRFNESRTCQVLWYLKPKGKRWSTIGFKTLGERIFAGKHAGTRSEQTKMRFLYLNSPEGVSKDGRRKMLDRLKELHEIQLEKTGDPVLETRIAQYEMGYRMQSSIPEVTARTKNQNPLSSYMGMKPVNPVPLPPTAYLPGGWLKRSSLYPAISSRLGPAWWSTRWN